MIRFLAANNTKMANMFFLHKYTDIFYFIPKIFFLENLYKICISIGNGR